jgi:hypothetical protein
MPMGCLAKPRPANIARESFRASAVRPGVLFERVAAVARSPCHFPISVCDGPDQAGGMIPVPDRGLPRLGDGNLVVADRMLT